jgi:hypothetical protein
LRPVIAVVSTTALRSVAVPLIPAARWTVVGSPIPASALRPVAVPLVTAGRPVAVPLIAAGGPVVALLRPVAVVAAIRARGPV